jgi:hypothetical protein
MCTWWDSFYDEGTVIFVDEVCAFVDFEAVSCDEAGWEGGTSWFGWIIWIRYCQLSTKDILSISPVGEITPGVPP